MAKTPSRAGRRPKKGSRFVSDVLAENIRVLRAMRGLSQAELAERMKFLKNEWSRQTVSQVEGGDRLTSVNELLALAIALETSVPRLMDPRPFDDRPAQHLDVGALQPLDPQVALDLIRSDHTVSLKWEKDPMKVTLRRVTVHGVSLPGFDSGDDEEDSWELTYDFGEEATPDER